MKKFILGLIFAIILLTLSGCSYPSAYKGLHPLDEVVSVDIVQVGKRHRDKNNYLVGPPDLTVLAEIEDIDGFLEDFSAMDCTYSFFTEPIEVYPGLIVIKFEYANGDFNLIEAETESTYYAEDNRYSAMTAFYFFDREQFDALLLKYYNQYDPDYDRHSTGNDTMCDAL